jgi:hypothetical protein
LPRLKITLAKAGNEKPIRSDGLFFCLTKRIEGMDNYLFTPSISCYNVKNSGGDLR